MECLKCGRETQGREVFCPACLKVMAASPVKPGTPVTLPIRSKSEKKVPARKQIKPEEQILRLRKVIRNLWIVIGVLCVLFLLSNAFLLARLQQAEAASNIGQNYSTISPEKVTIGQ